jgi:hypothetical protein
MFNLIKKDFITNRHLLMIFSTFPFYFIILFYGKEGFAPAFSISVIWALVLPFLFLSQEEKNHGYPLICSLPVNKKTLFISKYLSAWGASVAALCYFLLVGFVLAKLLKAPNADSILDISATDIFIYIFLVGINISVFFPLLIRYGSVNAATIGIVIMNFFGIVLFTLKKKTGIFATVIGFIEKGAEVFNNIANNIKAVAGNGGYYLVLLIIAFLINYTSYRILLFVFRKREL